jgi:hypothetical protein
MYLYFPLFVFIFCLRVVDVLRKKQNFTIIIPANMSLLDHLVLLGPIIKKHSDVFGYVVHHPLHVLHEPRSITVFC